MKQKQLLLSVLMLVFCFSAQARIYVKPVASGTGDGSSWENAKGSLMDAISAAPADEEIWVMEGEYKPWNGWSFQSGNGKKIYGSFAGTETEFYEGYPDTITYKTYLLPSADNRGVMEFSNSEWTGFHITGGNNGGMGGAMYVGTDGKLSYCSLYGNKAGNAGGAIDTDGGIFENCEIHHNSTNGAGGGIFVRGNALLTNCNIHHNTAGAEAGGVVLKGATSVMDNCIVSDNIASTIGNGKAGGVLLDNGATIKNSIISNNIASTAGYGEAGGVWGIGNIDNSIIENNIATTFEGVNGTAGGISMFFNTDPISVISNSIIRGNKTSSHMASVTDGEGGGIFISGKNEVVNCLIENNEAFKCGGISANGQLNIINCTIVGNKAFGQIGGIFVGNETKLINSIVWGNTAPEPAENDAYNYWGGGIFTNSIFSGANDIVNENRTNNFNADPQFVNAAIGDYRVKATSPAINAGNSALYLEEYPIIDLAGGERIIGSSIDIGAYEAKTHVVTLPIVTGATLNPAATSNKVLDGDNFVLTITLNANYSESTPVVTISRDGGEPETIALADGKYTITDILTDVAVTVEGIVLNPTDGINAPSKNDAKIYLSGRSLWIDAPSGLASIYTVLGAQQVQKTISGLTEITLPTGIYIVRLNGNAYKISVK